MAWSNRLHEHENHPRLPYASRALSQATGRRLDCLPEILFLEDHLYAALLKPGAPAIQSSHSVEG